MWDVEQPQVNLKQRTYPVSVIHSKYAILRCNILTADENLQRKTDEILQKFKDLLSHVQKLKSRKHSK